MTSPVAVVTGASRGIGKQLCMDLAGAGYDVVVAARSSADSPSRLPGTIEETAELVRAHGRQAMVVPLDVRDEEAVAALAERVYGEWGQCDLLVNNAAIAVPGATLEQPTKRWRLAVDVNLNGPLYMMYYFCPRMASAGGGRVVNISSIAAVTPEFGRVSYTVTKRALEALTEAMASELAGRVAVNCIRLELAVWSEGFTSTLPGEDFSDFEDPVVMSDATLWLARQPLDYTGHILTVGELRERGLVRGVTRIGDREG
ncbi:MAG: SDR family NAD(P)-dependent oxidoreductase [Dehalococcoidia bacterium]|nr:SDR family NAD(P)-dependent oxidoreductase [Dehalococcoidia bacterium]